MTHRPAPPRLRRLVVLVAALLTASACRTSDPADGPFAVESIALDETAAPAGFVPVLDGPLRVLSATPQGSLRGRTPGLAVTVAFSRPMVPLGEAPPVPDGVLRVTPPVPGTLRWDGTQTLVLEPTAELPPATAYTVEVAGVTALDGTALEAPYRWTFETPRPTVVYSEPAGGEPYADPAQALVLRFDQSVAAPAARRHVRLYAEDGATAVDAALRQDGDSTLVLAPDAPLTPGAGYRLVVDEALPARLGPLPAGQTRTITFRTYGRPALTAVDQARAWWQDATEALDPERAVTLTFATPVRFGDLRRSLRFDPPAPPPPGLEARDDVVSATHTWPGPWQPETRYTAVVDSLRDAFGQLLAADRATFRTRAYTPSVSMPEGVLVIEADQRTALPMRATNVDRVQLALERLSADTIVPRLRAYDPHHDYGAPPDGTDEPRPAPAERMVRLEVPRNVPSRPELALDSVLAGGTGVVGVHVRAGRQPGWREARAFRAVAQVTRLGLTAKFSPHQNLVFVTDLATARPVAGATVTVRDADNRVRWQGATDAQGQAQTPGWSRLGLTKPSPWQPPLQVVTVEHDGDLAFTSSVYQDGLEPYRFGVDYAWWPEAETEAGTVFTDRGLYRSGDEVHLKGILRSRSDADWRPLRDSVRVLVHSPRDEVVLDRRLRPSDLGTFDLTWSAPPSASQGVYTVRVVHASDTAATTRDFGWERGDVAQGTFRVEAFRTSTFAVEARSTRDGYVAGDRFLGSVQGRYLFGAAMRGQPVRYRLRRAPAPYTPPGFDAYRFGRPDDDDGTLYTVLAQADTVLDADGRLTVEAFLPGTERGSSATVILEATVTDPARQELSARTTQLLHPGLFYVGLKPATTFLDLARASAMTVDVAVVDPAGATVGGQAVEVALVRRQWNSVREVGVDGRLRWRSERTEEVVARQTIRSERGRAQRLRLPVPAGGSYVVRSTARDVRGNTVQTDAFFYATGGGYVAWERTDDDRVELVPERTTYRPGETARLLVPSPYERATALVTVEREGILESRVVTLEGSAPQVEVPLTEAHLPNVFVSVILLQGRTAAPGPQPDVGAPAFKIGYATLRVDPGVRHLQVAVQPERATYRPGDEVVVDLRLRDAGGAPVAGEIAFSAADAGVLNLVGYRLPDPFETFYGPRPLHVATAESRAHLVRQRSFGQKEEDLGGGGGEADRLLRQDFRPLAHWAPAVRTDARGRARVTFRLPESLTTFRLMATALTAGSAFGAGHADVVVTQPLVLQPALPRFARLGDAFEAGVLVTNTTGAAGTATIAAAADGAVLDGPASQPVALADGETKEVRFRWRAGAPGEARLRFEARLGGERDALAVPLPVRRPLARRVSATFASTTDRAEEALSLPPDRLPDLGGLRVQLAGSALVGLDGAVRYLFDYPYGCLEQQTSRIRPLLIAAPLLEAFDLDVLDGDRDAVVRTWLDELDAFWTGDGFALWTGGRVVNAYVTAYVALALAEARDAGFDADAERTAALLDGLAQHVRDPGRRPAWYTPAVWADARALMLYALARHGRLLTAELDALARAAVEDAGRLSVEGESLLLRTLVRADVPALNGYRRALLERLRGRVRMEATTAYAMAPADEAYAWIFASDVRATAYTLAALVEAAPTAETQALAERMVRYLIEQRAAGHWASTQDNAAVLDGLRRYYDAFEGDAPALDADVRVAGRSVLAASFSGRSLAVQEAEVRLSDLPETAPVTVAASGRGRLYYALELETYTAAPQPASSQGLTVERRLQRLDDAGRPRGPDVVAGSEPLALSAGEAVRVTLRVVTPADRHYVVVDDALPAGLEALNPAFDTADRRLTADTGGDRWWGSFGHTEFRDDRVLLFADVLERGEHMFTYVARATTPGTFVYPGAQAEQMYRPETRGRTAAGTLTVRAPDAPRAQR